MGRREDEPAFEVRERSTGEIPILELAGALDFSTVLSIQLRVDALFERPCNSFIVDLSRATLLTSAVINLLFATVRRLHLTGGGLAVVCSDPSVCKLLDLTAFTQAAPVCKTEHEALTALNQQLAAR